MDPIKRMRSQTDKSWKRDGVTARIFSKIIPMPITKNYFHGVLLVGLESKIKLIKNYGNFLCQN